MSTGHVLFDHGDGTVTASTMKGTDADTHQTHNKRGNTNSQSYIVLQFFRG